MFKVCIDLIIAIVTPSIYFDVQKFSYLFETRLTYNYAHLRSIKECLTLEYLEKENKSIAEKEEGGKYLKGEIVILQRRRKTGKEKEENIWRKNIFWFQSE